MQRSGVSEFLTAFFPFEQLAAALDSIGRQISATSGLIALEDSQTIEAAPQVVQAPRETSGLWRRACIALARSGRK